MCRKNPLGFPRPPFATPRRLWYFPCRSVYGAPLVLPNEFLQAEEFSVDQIVKKFSKIIDTPAISLPSQHIVGCLLPNELPADLLCASLIWVCNGGTILRSSGPTTAPTPCFAVVPAPSPSDSGCKRRSSTPATWSPAQTTPLSRAFHVALADHQAPARWPRWLPAAAAVYQQPSRSRLKTDWYLLLLSDLRSSPACIQEPFLSYLARRFL